MIPNKKHYARQGLRQHTGKDKQCDVVRLTCGKARSTCSPVNPGSNTHFKNIRIAHTYGTFSFKNINNTPNSTNDMILKSRAKKNTWRGHRLRARNACSRNNRLFKIILRTCDIMRAMISFLNRLTVRANPTDWPERRWRPTLLASFRRLPASFQTVWFCKLYVLYIEKKVRISKHFQKQGIKKTLEYKSFCEDTSIRLNYLSWKRRHTMQLLKAYTRNVIIKYRHKNDMLLQSMVNSHFNNSAINHYTKNKPTMRGCDEV